MADIFFLGLIMLLWQDPAPIALGAHPQPLLETKSR